MSRLSFKGILVGGITDIVATNILALPIIGYVMLRKIDIAQLSSNQVAHAITAALQANRPLFVLQLLVGSGCSVLGGYVGARLAKHDELLNGLLTSFLCLAFGAYSLVQANGTRSISLNVMGIVASPVLGLLGGYLRVKQESAKGTMLQSTPIAD